MPVQVNLYEAFGGIEASWGNSKNNRLANTKERDASIALDNHGFRYYDASIGRYISNDPIGYEGGFNLYVHCTNDPVNKFDPLGLFDNNDPNNWYLEDSHEGDAKREQQMADQKKYQEAEAARKESEQRKVESEIKRYEEEYRQRVAELRELQNAGSSPEAIADNDYALRSLDYFLDVDGRKYNYHFPAGDFGWVDFAKGSTAQANIESQMAMLQLNIGAMQQAKIVSNNVTDIKNKAVESTGGKTADAKSEGQGAAPQVNAEKSAASEPPPSNPVPNRLARVVPEDTDAKLLGRPGSSDVFVTAAEDIQKLNAQQIAQKLTIPESPTGFKVIEFEIPTSGIASPINRTNPGFVGGGQTAGGAREFVIPNQPISSQDIVRTVR